MSAAQIESMFRTSGTMYVHTVSASDPAFSSQYVSVDSEHIMPAAGGVIWYGIYGNHRMKDRDRLCHLSEDTASTVDRLPMLSWLISINRLTIRYFSPLSFQNT